MKAGSTREYQQLSGGKYLELAKNNDSHFAGKNLEIWHKHHLEALDAARGAGKDKDRTRQPVTTPSPLDLSRVDLAG